MKIWLSKMGNAVLDVLFPPRCLVCDEVVPIGAALCGGCKQTLCDDYANRLREAGNGRGVLNCVSAFGYDSKTFQLLKVIKSGRGEAACHEAARLMALAFNASDLANTHFDYITEVPMRQSEKQRRGYNQAELLTGILSRLLDITYLPSPLYQTERHLTQHKLSAEQRRKNAADSYKLFEGARVDGEILLIDDIITTGSTLKSCAKLLIDAGAARVCCLTAAATEKKRS